MTAPPADEQPREPAPEPPAGDGPAEDEPTDGAAPEERPAPRRRLFRRRPAASSPAEVGTPGDGPRPPGVAALRRRRRELALRRQESVYHLGGLAFELYRRDRLPAGVMRRRAEEVAELDRTVGEIDAWLVEIDRARRERREARGRKDAGAQVGCCLRCRASFAAEARFCWSCGVAFLPPPEISEQVTEVLSADEGEHR